MSFCALRSIQKTVSKYYINLNNNKNRQILIKRIYFDKSTYDYKYVDKFTALKIINSTRHKTKNVKFERAEWYISILYWLKKIIKSEFVKKFFYIILTLLITYVFKIFFQ